MTYSPTRHSLGFIQASAVSSTTASDVVFDIPNDMSTTASEGKTDLKDNCILVMRLSRDNDGTTARSSAYYANSGLTNLKYRGRIPSETSNYFQVSEDAFDYADSAESTGSSEFGAGEISFTDYSHVRIWRLDT